MRCIDIEHWTQYLRNKLEQLERKLESERAARKRLELDVSRAVCKPVAPGQLQLTTSDKDMDQSLGNAS